MANAPSTESRDRVRGTVPKLIDLSEKVLFGDVWERPQLSKRDRSLIVCATLISTYRPEQLRGHLQRALDNGAHQGGTIRGDHASRVLCRLAGGDDGGEHRAGGVRGQPVRRSTTMQAGFIGLGTMGASMAANLQKGSEGARRHAGGARHPPRGRRSPYKDGAIWADSPQSVAEQSDVIFTSLPGPPEFEAVSGDGLLAGIKKGAAYFDLTTNSPTVVRKAHDGIRRRRAPICSTRRSAADRAARRAANWRSGAAAIRTCSTSGSRCST